MVRIILAVSAYASVLFAPPWVPLIIAGVLALRFSAWEIIPLGILIDFLYLPHTEGDVFNGPWGIPFPATLIALVLAWGFEPIRRQWMR